MERGIMAERYDLAILGGGPGGYVAAIRAGQLGKKVLLIEKDKLGGTCMNYGCIPTKYLLHQTKFFQDLKSGKNLDGPFDKVKCNWRKVQQEKQSVVDRLVRGVEFLLKKNGVEVIKGNGFLRSEKQVSVEIDRQQKIFESYKIILATGSRPSNLPFLEPNGREVVTSQQALEFENVPQTMLVIGAGAIGLEIGTIYHRLGSDVSILEIMPTILPGNDRETVLRLERILKTQGLKVFTEMRIEKCRIEKERVIVEGNCLKTQSPFRFEAEKVLLAAGRKPSFEIQSGGLSPEFDRNGFITANSKLETSIPGVYAIGDVIGGKLLAHKASHEGILAAENASGMNKEVDYRALPMAVYTEPEFSSVGLSEEEAKEKGIKTQVGLFSLQANGRALTIGKQEGMVKLLADEKDRVIGAHILAPNASEIISEITLAISKGLKVQDVSSSFHIHPTLSEALMETALKVKNQAIHVLNA